MDRTLYSLRMRATINGRHVCGAERIVLGGEVAAATAALVGRAADRPGWAIDAAHCTLERLDPASILEAVLPDVSTRAVADVAVGRRLSLDLLARAGVADSVARQALELLIEGPGPCGSVMRGAVLMHARTGERLEPDPVRGVRVSRMDLAPGSRDVIHAELGAAGLGHRRVAEALVLAGKALMAPGLVAELCWSDDPDYTTGYVADRRYGYQRIAPLKEQGDDRGGRVFLIEPAGPVAELVDFLERRPVLFSSLGKVGMSREVSQDND